MKLYGVPLSPFVRKVLFTLDVLDLSCDHEELAPGSDDSAFRKTSPAGRIPGFADGDFQIADSAAICRYLVTRERSELMGGPSPQRQARIVQWETWGDADLGPALLAPLLERVVKPVRLGQATDEARVETALAESLPPVYAELDAALAHRGPWLIGEAFSYADIAIASHLSTAEIADVLPSEGTYPALGAWLARVRGQRGYQTLMDITRDYIARSRNA